MRDPFDSYIQNRYLTKTPKEKPPVGANTSTATKTPHDKTRSSLKTKDPKITKNLFGSDRKEFRGKNQKGEDKSFGAVEGNDMVPNESDPTVGWIKISKNEISHVPDEQKRFDSFWKERQERHSSSDNSQKYSEHATGQKVNGRKSRREQSVQLRTALLQSAKRIKHFNDFKSKSPKRKPESAYKNIKDAE